MNEYINVHFALEALREQAAHQGRDGPRVLILGPDNAGKSTLAKILTGYGVRSAKSPVVVNLDVNEGVMSIPGTLTSTVFKTLSDVEEGWGTAPMSGPNGAIPVKLPLVYYFGAEHPEEKEGKVYKAQITRLGLAITGRMTKDAEAREGGVIIDTPGSLTSTKFGTVGYEVISHIVSELQVSAIICLGSERLYADMVKRYDGTPTTSRASPTGAGAQQETISVVKLPKSGGCVDRDASFMSSLRSTQVRAYFYGNPRLSNGIALQARQQQVDFSSLSVYRRITSSSFSTTSASYEDEDTFRPGDAEENPSSVPLPPSQIFEHIYNPQPGMRNCVLAVMNCAPEAEQDELRDSSVMGFLYVTDIDEMKGRISLLSPVAGRVPDRAIVWAPWPEGVLGLA